MRAVCLLPPPSPPAERRHRHRDVRAEVASPGGGGGGGSGGRRMETDCNPMELPNNTGFEEDSDYGDFEGTDVKDMRLEAEAVVNDVLFAVSNMFVSKTLPCAEDVAYINVETRERNRYCLELTEAGLRVVAYDFDQTDDRLQTPYHETVYSLLDSLSPAYREVFGNALLQRLEALKKESQS
ncbi:GSK3B-interacting protein isoform X1 [Chroicocephalus ridibundus]